MRADRARVNETDTEGDAPRPETCHCVSWFCVCCKQQLCNFPVSLHRSAPLLLLRSNTSSHSEELCDAEHRGDAENKAPVGNFWHNKTPTGDWENHLSVHPLNPSMKNLKRLFFLLPKTNSLFIYIKIHSRIIPCCLNLRSTWDPDATTICLLISSVTKTCAAFVLPKSAERNWAYDWSPAMLSGFRVQPIVLTFKLYCNAKW